MQDVLNGKGTGESRLRAGTARVNITPPVGAWLSGYDARTLPSQGVHDELYGKALVLADGQTRLAILTADLIALSPETVAGIRRQVTRTTGIPGDNLLVSVSHTHAGPVTERLEMIEEPDRGYMAELERRLAGVVYVANSRMQEATLGVGAGGANFNVNRRLVTPEGVVMRPNPQGTVDRRVGVIRVDGADGEPIAVLMHYACHATAWPSSNLLISADYPGAAQRLVEQVYGPGCTAMFLQGCSGDIRPHLADADGRFRGGTSREVVGLGRILGAEVIKVCEQIETCGGPVAVRPREVDIPLQSPPARTELVSLIDDLENRSDLDNDAKVDLIWARAVLSQLQDGTAPTSVKAEVQAMRLGEGCLVALPGEVLVEIGLRIQSLGRSPTFVVGLANGCIGYIPTAESLRQQGRNYEANFAYKAGLRPAPFAPEIEDVMVNTAVSLLASL